MLAPIIERIMLHLDEYVYVLRDAGRDSTVIENMTRSCERLTDKYQRAHHDCPFCGGAVRTLVLRNGRYERISEHDDSCLLGE